MPNLLIYGASGYTGSLASEYAKSIGLDIVLAGKTETTIKKLALSRNLPYRVFDLSDAQTVQSSLKGIRVVLNCAGPFAHTAGPLIDACIKLGIHYLDVSAELASYQLAEERHSEAKEANVMLLPGCGGSVVMLGCLASCVVESVNHPTSIDIALRVAGPISRGSAVSAIESVTSRCLCRHKGVLVEQEEQTTMQFDFDDGKGKVDCFPVTLPDLITIENQTAVSDIRTFVHVSDGGFPSGNLADLPRGPTYEQRRENPYHAAVAVTSSDHIVKRAALHTVNGYEFTFKASVEAARRVLSGEAQGGFQTPAGVFGKDFVRDIQGSYIQTL